MLSPIKPSKVLPNGQDNPRFAEEMEAYQAAMKDKKEHPLNWGVKDAPPIGAALHENQAASGKALTGKERTELERLREQVEAQQAELADLLQRKAAAPPAGDADPAPPKTGAFAAVVRKLKGAKQKKGT